MSATEKRKFPRLPVNLPATYSSANLALDVHVSNISQSGLSLRCSDVEPIGTAAEITLALPTESEPLRLSGRVIWVHADPDSESAMGIGFDELPEAARLVLVNYVLRSSGVGPATS